MIANLALCREQLVAKVQRCLRAGPCTFHVLVPATPDPHLMTWTEEEVQLTARHRLNQALSAFQELNANVDGEIGDSMPLLAVEDVLRTEQVDEIIVVSTPSSRVSRWMRLDLPHRVARRFGLPVDAVIRPTDRSSGAGYEVAA